MPLVEAYKRTKNYTHVFADLTLKFTANDLGHIVCDVAAQDVIDRLLATPTGFRLYGSNTAQGLLPVEPPVLSPVLTVPSGSSSTPAPVPAPASEPEKAAEPEASPYLLVNGDSKFDLRPLTDTELFEFARANAIPVHPNSKGDTIRDKIVAFLKAPE